ncbi:hypothetical protein [Malaciobacter mytili]|nr:hypothetical protein [Malaciobacter mytili]
MEPCVEEFNLQQVEAAFKYAEENHNPKSMWSLEDCAYAHLGINVDKIYIIRESNKSSIKEDKEDLLNELR